jgi:hypothetical protein
MTRMHRRILLAAAAAAAAACLAPLPAAAANTIELTTLSSPADMASDGNALVEVAVPADLALADVVVKLNGADVTSMFVADAAGHRLVGLVAGLGLGNNTLKATSKRVRGEDRQAGSLTIRNFPATGPIFSGVRQSPWICETAASGLGPPPSSGPCTAPVRYDWFYRTTANTFVALPSASPPYPADLATTTTVDGKVVPYIVRVESGVINESIYRIAILDDPANPIANPWKAGGKKPGAGWNGKLTWPFGGGASPAYRSGSNTVQSALQHDPLSLGFAVAFGTRNTYGTGSDDVISAETVMMIKERFIEQYGVPRFTIGSGGSGGSMLQHYMTQNYPGMLDALTPGISYSDLTSIASDVIDCKLLGNYFDKVVDPAAWPGTRRAAVDGYAVATTGGSIGKTVCQTGWAGFPNNWPNPTNGFSTVVPAALIYNPVTNPTGLRGTFWDSNVNSFGKDPATGFARTPYDNVGIQYGLRAVNSGAITPEEFVHLNEHVGGIDIDANLIPQRSVADTIGLRRAYASGRIVTSFENMTLPIIDTRIYTDLQGDIHNRHRTLVFLERLQRANGTTANQVNWNYGGTGSPNIARLALLANNQWLENIAADASNLPYAAKVIKNKPADLKDACWVNGTKIEEPISWDPNTACNQALPVHSDVRLMAGGAITGDVLKCKLMRLDFSQYQVTFTADQQARLRATFPNGVCDWSDKGVGQVPLSDTWIDYSKGRWGPANVYD